MVRIGKRAPQEEGALGIASMTEEVHRALAHPAGVVQLGGDHGAQALLRADGAGGERFPRRGLACQLLLQPIFVKAAHIEGMAEGDLAALKTPRTPAFFHLAVGLVLGALAGHLRAHAIQVQLADQVALVAGLGQNAGQDGKGRRQVDAIGAHGMRARREAGEERRAAGHAERIIHIMAIEPHPRGGQPVDVGRAHDRIAIAPEVVLTMLIGDDHKNIRLHGTNGSLVGWIGSPEQRTQASVSDNHSGPLMQKDCCSIRHSLRARVPLGPIQRGVLARRWNLR